VKLYTTDHLSDSRWDDLVARYPRASVLHERGWLEALRRTYGYEPFVLTNTPPGKTLSDGMVVCRVAADKRLRPFAAFVGRGGRDDPKCIYEVAAGKGAHFCGLRHSYGMA